MKKSVVSALTVALAVGMASTTFAAANPFADVPADHWSYDAIAQLAADGVIDGYGDGTYRGADSITRYEMSMMIARAMAKSGLSDADRAMLDKLSAEYADELKALGVRVSNLEKKVDNVKWPGEVRYRYVSSRSEGFTRGGYKAPHHANGDGHSKDLIRFRVNPVMTINKHWVGKARVDYDTNWTDAKNADKVSVDRTYVEGTYDGFMIDLGKLPVLTDFDYGMTSDVRMAGAQAVIGKDVKVKLFGGRLNAKAFDVFGGRDASDAHTYNYQGIEVYNNRKNKFTWGAGYQRIGNKVALHALNLDKNNLGIWGLGLGYRFTKDLQLTGAYARTSADYISPVHGSKDVDSKMKQAYNIQLNYGKVNAKKPGSYELFLAYRHLGDFGTIHTTYIENGPVDGGVKGFEIGGTVALDKNITGELRYFRGKLIEDYADGKDGYSALWSQIRFLF